jgi:hypothetical protein
VVSGYLPKALAKGFSVAIVGLHKTTDAARLESLDNYLQSGLLKLCGQLSDAQVAAEYQEHEITWVHSLREGFGRCLIEGRLARSRVICSNIPEFLTQRDEMHDPEIYLYNNPAEFMATLERLTRTATPPAPFDGYPYRAMLRSAIESAF